MERIKTSQLDCILEAAKLMAGSIGADGWVYLFGSGHSVIPVMDVFPRYGSFVGFRPLLDPRLMWFNVTGPGGAPELLWLECQEGYIANFLKNYTFSQRDCLVVYSHGGVNAAPIEAGLYARERGSKIIAVTSMQNHRVAAARHSTGKKLADVADIVIDNCVTPEDSQVDVGQPEKVAAGSTLGVIVISMALVAETGAMLLASGFPLDTFVSPNVPDVCAGHNEKIFRRYRERLAQ